MVVSILHRATGVALSFVGLGILAWWLLAISSGPDAYGNFEAAVNYRFYHIPLMLIVLVGLTWSFFQHLLSGIRHLTMDTGAAFELGVNKTFAIFTIVGSLVLTAAMWVFLLGVAK
jgi:succinate dehydrogenase / fumarate reductase, cytochrome b subunit